MSIIKWAEDSCKKLGLVDTKLVSLVGVCAGFLLAKWIPSIVNISAWWFIGVGVLLTAKVYYTIFTKK